MMFKKGDPKPVGSGIKLGQKCAPTLRKEMLREQFQRMEDKIFDYVESLPPAKAARFYLELKEYFDPKLSRVENKQDGPIVIDLSGLSREDIEKLAK